MQVLAGAETYLRWDGQTGTYAPKTAKGKGPVFTIRALDYFTAQGVLNDDDAVEKIRKCIAAGLVAIDGDEAKAEEFKVNPRAPMVNPLFNEIWMSTWGNF